MSTINIKTTQNVVIEYELAALRERLLALLVDFMIVGAVYLILSLAMIAPVINSVDNSGMLGVIFSLLPILLFLIYQLASEVLADGQSWGKKALGIKVVRLDGQEPGLSDYLLRTVFHLPDTLFTGGILAALLISSSEKNQRLGDITANTTVIRVRHSLRFQLDDILNINSLENYTPKYPEVKTLSEQDMLVIKGVISRYRTHNNPAHEEAITQLVERLRAILDIKDSPGNKVEFLRTLIRDYIVITR
jgi:uncharacterized RDD family membrane protein YckC